MKQELENLKEISIDDIRQCLKKHIPNDYDKMIISSDNQIKRADFYYIKHKSTFLTRKGKIVKFPLFGAIKDNFAEFEGGEQKHNVKCVFPQEKILDTLQSIYEIIPEDYDITSVNNPFEFPVDYEGDHVLPNQRKYFIPDLTFQEQCDECNGKKYVTCPDLDCKGEHIYTCTECNGNRRVSCGDCNGSGWNRCRILYQVISYCILLYLLLKKYTRYFVHMPHSKNLAMA